MNRIYLILIAWMCGFGLTYAQTSDYKYEDLYKNLLFDMPRVQAPVFPDTRVRWAMERLFAPKPLPEPLMNWRLGAEDIWSCRQASGLPAQSYSKATLISIWRKEL